MVPPGPDPLSGHRVSISAPSRRVELDKHKPAMSMIAWFAAGTTAGMNAKPWITRAEVRMPEGQ